MDDSELILLTPILENLNKVEDVRPYIELIVNDDRVLYNKAAQIFQGGKVGERSRSQKTDFRSFKGGINDMSSDNDLDLQSGNLKQDSNGEEDPKILSIYENNKHPAMAYFKSLDMKSKLQSPISNPKKYKRNTSQKRSHLADSNKLHYMPVLDKLPSPVNAVENGWISNYDKSQNSSSIDTSHRFLNKERTKISPGRVQAIIPK